jgi:uncharacterized membrane protein
MGFFWILILVAVVWFARNGELARWIGRLDAPDAPKVDPALEALRRRYALGEIDADEFARRKADLA